MNTFSAERFNQMPLVGIMRNMPAHKIEKLATGFHAAGLTTLEITMNSDAAVETIGSLVNHFGDRLNIGAGTVCSLRDLDNALSAGAQFIVTPIINEEVITACVKAGVPIFPGAYTPTEIYKAWSMGASMVKVFPATKLGAEYIKEVLAPLDTIKLLPTGGITIDNLGAFFKAGAKGVGLGSNLFPKDLIEHDAWDELNALFKKFVNTYQSITNANSEFKIKNSK